MSSKIKLLTPYCKVFLIFSLFIFHFSFAVAQQHVADSLRRLVVSGKEDTNRLMSLLRYSQVLEGLSDLKTGDSVSDLAIALAKKLDNRKGLAMGIFKKAVFLDEEGNYAGAITGYKRATVMFDSMQDKANVARGYCNIGIVYWEMGNYTSALENYLKGLKMDEQIGDKEGVARGNANIGLIYMTEKDYPNALQYNSQALKVFNELGEKEPVANVESNLGVCYFQTGKVDSAFVFYNNAQKLYEELGNKSGVASTLSTIGDAYALQNNFEKALDYFFQSLKIHQATGNMPEVANIMGHMGEAYYRLGKYADAEKYLKRSAEMADSIHFLRLSGESDMVLSETYAKMNRWKDAYEWAKMFSVTEDSLTSADKSKEMGKLEAQADYDKQIALQQAEEEKRAAISKAESQRQNTVIAFIAIVALAAGGIAIAVFRSLKVTRKQKEEIEKQKKAVEEQKSIVEVKNEEILDSITYAKRLQDAILPPLRVIEKYLPDSFVFYKPKDIVAGDFYWMYNIPLSVGEGKLGEVIFIAACDCTGHGVPGAMVSVVCSNALNRAVKEFGLTDPGKILDKTRELVIETFSTSEGNIQDGMDISLCSITPLTAGEGVNWVRLNWSGAYNALWSIAGGKLTETPADKQPIGKTDKPKPFTLHTITLNKGDSIYLFTDGYADQFGGPKGKKFKYKQLQELLLANAAKPMAEQKKVLEAALESWKGDLEQVDDILIIGIRV